VASSANRVVSIMKILMIVGVLLFAIELMTAHDQVSGQRPTRQGQQDAQGPPAPSIAPITNNLATAYYQQDSTDKPHGWHKFVTWPESITAWLVMLTLGAITWQAIETHRAAQGARDAASAALEQANHIVASERAWLILSSANREDQLVRPGHPPLYWWKVKNIGSTPAKIIEIQAVCGILENKLPEEPKFPLPIQLHGRMLAPGEGLEFNTFWTDSNGAMLRDNVESLGTMHLVAFGYVKYLTVLDSDSHGSGFCDDCIYFSGPHPTTQPQRYEFRPYLDAPPNYCKST
jgi:hypothetical protein